MLLPSDIFLWQITPDANLIDRLIGWGERRLSDPNSDVVNYYHVGIVGPDALHYYDSAPGGVKNSLTPIPFPLNLEIFRFKTPLSPAHR